MSTITVADSTQTFSRAMKNCSFMCSVLVILIHTYNLEVYKIGPDAIIYWIESLVTQNITTCAVPFFFMSSAFFLYQKVREISSVYKSRFKSIVLPYLLWNALYMVALSFLKSLSLSNVGMDRINIMDILKGIFLYQYNYVYWFMFYLILFTLLYPVIKQLVYRNKLICFSCLAILLAVRFFNIINHNILTSFIYYYLGAIGGCYYKERIEKITTMHKKKNVAIIVLFIVNLALGMVTRVSNINISIINNLVTIVLLLLISSLPKVTFPKFLLGLSFMIYSMHSIILECVEKIIFIVFPHNALWATIDYFLAPIITLMIVVACCVVMKKICPRLYGILNGNRK